ncbi:hypothetical protein C469_07361 [Halorubrum lipolyticum DSM 21995]|uniref:Uncharacterized protein n=2 Tax=Halorubrum lipolyticum TaxID=368624 RepID=M0NVD1_9EURY|nr:hypothetical protein C469_07361 [Halorubrum lipolyticum DSM 21995]
MRSDRSVAFPSAVANRAVLAAPPALSGMAWSLGREDDVITEWERSDGYATVRLRERGDGGFVVRLDVMEQAADESAYERERFDDREAALDRAAAWREERDVD